MMKIQVFQFVTIFGCFVTANGRAADLCVPVTPNGSFCNKMPYNVTTFPNVLGMPDAGATENEIIQFRALVQFQCSDVIKEFLCSAYFPACDSIIGLIPPCRQTCKAARLGCEDLMNQFGFKWPSKLNCDDFPEYFKGARCTFFNSTMFSETTAKSTPMSEPMATSTSKPTPTPSSTYLNAKPGKTAIPQLPTECRNIPYQSAFFPNVLGHWSFGEAVKNFARFKSMLSSGCSQRLSKYLCLLHFPAYDESRKKALPPCWEFCLSVRTQCLFKLPVPWPQSFACESLPSKITPGSQCWAGDSTIASAPSAIEIFQNLQGVFKFLKGVVSFVTGF